MPAVRDISWNATTAATGTTINIAMPAFAQNDLLLAIICADTGAGVWTSAGWTHVTGSPSSNTAQLVCMWKIAGASEADPTFTSTVSESYNGAIVSIRDVNTTTPFGSTPIISFTTQASAAKFNMQTVTTNVANSLLIYASANSAAGQPSFLEGPSYGLLGADGLAEGLGIGWGFKATAGVTSANVGVSNSAAGAGVKMVLQIVPPSGGATIIPTYCAADASFYIDPLAGTSAFNGNTAMAATADTGFGTSLGGFVAADAGVTAVTDVGINSFHSAARLTSITGSKNLSAAELVVVAANRTNFTGKNILCHVGPSTEGQLQRFSAIASGRGIWFGMRSGAATNFKIWQVYGAELGSLRHQPIVINSSAVNTKVTTGTLDPATVLAFGFWVSGTGVTTTVWDFASLWMVDTVTIAGGNAAEPINIPGIVASAATGKERRSVVLQGANQMIAYQPIQIGDAGTNPTYMILDSTAIEFPTQYNAASKAVQYNSIDNAVGLSYNAGSTDTIKHTNSIISSKSRYTWGFNAASSTAATYDFSGLAVIGAGTITLKAGITLSEVTFQGCSEFSSAGATLTGCVFKGQIGTASAISVSSPANMALITGGTVSGNSRGIKITTAGTYTFSGIQFATNTFDVDNASGGAVIINATNGSNVSTFTNSAGGSVTINNSKTLTLTGLIPNSEVRIYSRDGGGNSDVELGGIENCSATFAYNYNFGANPTVNIVVLKNDYQYYAINNYTLGATDASLPIQQIPDRQYSNPA